MLALKQKSILVTKVSLLLDALGTVDTATFSIFPNPCSEDAYSLWAHYLNSYTQLTLIVSSVTSENLVWALSQGGKSCTSSMSPFCPSHLRAREKLGERDQSSISGHHLKLGSQTFYDCWAKWIWDTGNSLYLSSRQPHFLASCSPLPRSHWLPSVEVLILQRQTEAPTLPGLNRLDFPHWNVFSDTSLL